MEEYKLLSKLERVKAPPDFEEKVIAELDLRKRKHVRVKRLRWTFAGACASVATVMLMISFGVFPQKSTHEYAELKKASTTAVAPQYKLNSNKSIPVTESVNYSGEVHNLTRDRETIYILEHVSDSTDTRIIY